MTLVFPSFGRLQGYPSFWIVLALKMHVICRFFRFQGVIVEIFALKQLMPFKNKPSTLRDYHFFLFGIRLFDARFFWNSKRFVWPGPRWVHLTTWHPRCDDKTNLNGLREFGFDQLDFTWVNQQKLTTFSLKSNLKWDFETALPIIFSIFSCLWVGSPP